MVAIACMAQEPEFSPKSPNFHSQYAPPPASAVLVGSDSVTPLLVKLILTVAPGVVTHEDCNMPLSPALGRWLLTKLQSGVLGVALVLSLPSNSGALLSDDQVPSWDCTGADEPLSFCVAPGSPFVAGLAVTGGGDFLNGQVCVAARPAVPAPAKIMANTPTRNTRRREPVEGRWRNLELRWGMAFLFYNGNVYYATDQHLTQDCGTKPQHC
jgi:hypothetical protein